MGLGTGSLLGIAAHMVGQIGNRRGFWKIPLNRNTAMLSLMLGGAAGSFLMAVSTGKNEVHRLHPIFPIGSHPSDQDDSYQQSLRRAKEREDNLRNMELSRSRDQATTQYVQHDLEAEREERKRNRLFRRASLQRSMKPGHGGLSDSHGGHWVNEDTRSD